MDERNASSGFREVEHTADWELNVWAPDLAALLAEAACGMYHLTNTRLEQKPRLQRELELEMFDREGLLVDFLTELLYYGETEQIGFDHFGLHLVGRTLQAALEGAPIRSQSKEIKAVTYHKLKVRQTERGLEVNVVFDV
jgi:SHS2 domain-containing protein